MDSPIEGTATSDWRYGQTAARRSGLTEGTLLADRWVLRGSLGRGGMAEVWRASDSRSSADVAAKVLHAAVAEDPIARSRLDREAAVASRVLHPRIGDPTTLPRAGPGQHGGVRGVGLWTARLLDGNASGRQCFRTAMLPDGNGRVGRLLNRLLPCHAGILHEPLLYLSSYCKQNRGEHYRLLDLARTEGDWEAWLSYLLEGVRQTENGAVENARRLTALFEHDPDRIAPAGRRAGSALRVLDVLRTPPPASLTLVCGLSGLSFPAAGTGMDLLVQLGVARELTGRRRNRRCVNHRHLAILDEGTESV